MRGRGEAIISPRLMQVPGMASASAKDRREHEIAAALRLRKKRKFLTAIKAANPPRSVGSYSAEARPFPGTVP